MRNYIIIPILIIIFGCVTHNAYGDSLTIKTDSDSYELGSTVAISGTGLSDNVIIQIKDHFDTTILVRTLQMDAGSFSLDFNIPHYYETGQYTIIASILIDEIPEITNIVIDVTPKISSLPNEGPMAETQKQEVEEESSSEGGGCLIATAAYGSEMAPQVQFLREIRDNTVLQTQSGTSFMTAFNTFYYTFSPAVADYERENPVFKEAVKVGLTPLLTSLPILNYVDIDTEQEMLGYGIGIIMLNIGMYFVAPAVVIIALKKRFVCIRS